MSTAADTFVIGDFPQLRLIAWNRDPRDTITSEEVFAFYERNWHFVGKNTMPPHERALVDLLTREYGHGILHV